MQKRFIIMSNYKQTQGVRTVWWEEDASGAAVCLLDQSLLPQAVVYLRLTTVQQVAEAIATLKVRGAPAIGVTAAFGIVLALYNFLQEQDTPLTLTQAQQHLHDMGILLSRTRPTAVNLFWAIERMQRCTDQAVSEQISLHLLAQLLRQEAQAIADEDFDACMHMGLYGADLICDGDTLLTHCNAGALATAGWGTALAPMYVAHQAGKRIHVRGDVKAVFVGADRIAANGDVANKIGTYGVAVLAHAHHIPFYGAAPCSTIDLSLPSGEQIPIEQRNPDEVTRVGGTLIAPPGVQAANPAFDVTPSTYVSAIITEKGIVRPPYAVGLHQICSENSI